MMVAGDEVLCCRRPDSWQLSRLLAGPLSPACTNIDPRQSAPHPGHSADHPRGGDVTATAWEGSGGGDGTAGEARCVSAVSRYCVSLRQHRHH